MLGCCAKSQEQTCCGCKKLCVTTLKSEAHLQRRHAFCKDKSCLFRSLHSVSTAVYWASVLPSIVLCGPASVDVCPLVRRARACITEDRQSQGRKPWTAVFGLQILLDHAILTAEADTLIRKMPNMLRSLFADAAWPLL